MEAARELFMEREYEEVSVEEILSRSGVSRGAMYHHFPTKLDLFVAVWRASERRVLEGIAERSASASGPFDALVLSAREYLRAAERDEELRRIGLGQSRAVLGWSRWRAEASSLGAGVAVAVAVAAAEAGELRSDDPETVGLVVLGALIEAAMLIVDAEDAAAARRRSEKVVVELLEGLRR